MLRLLFSGWCQIRLATDPDPFDEPAGVSGKTFALSDEDPLDRVIRFQVPVHARSGAPEIGVHVDEVCNDDGVIPGHPLQCARVDLLDGPVFEGRNGLIADDGLEPIQPFVLCIETDSGLAIRRDDPPGEPWNPDRPDPAALAHRVGSGLQAGPEVEAEIRATSGVHETEQTWREARRKHLEAALKDADPARRLGLELRLEMLEPIALVRVTYEFQIGHHGGDGTIEDPTSSLADRIDMQRAWPLAMWFGAWDADGLISFVHGELRLPLEP